MSAKENLIKIYDYALNQEQTGMSFFQTSLDRMGIGAAVSAFKRLIEEEENVIANGESVDDVNYPRKLRDDENPRSHYWRKT